MTSQKIEQLRKLANASLDRAESIWDSVGEQFNFSAKAAMEILENREIETQIPGHEKIREDTPEMGTFIALVADMRDSTRHLLQDISAKTTSINRLQRVFYETSVLLPCMSQAIRWRQGAVTEYLGDGVLSLFKVRDSEPKEAINRSYHAAHDCMDAVEFVINPLLEGRYNLPSISIGVGMAISKALITSVGLDNFKQAKVFGECVFRATKISGGNGIIVVDEGLELAWPTEKDGTISFTEINIRGAKGFQLPRKR